MGDRLFEHTLKSSGGRTPSLSYDDGVQSVGDITDRAMGRTPASLRALIDAKLKQEQNIIRREEHKKQRQRERFLTPEETLDQFGPIGFQSVTKARSKQGFVSVEEARSRSKLGIITAEQARMKSGIDIINDPTVEMQKWFRRAYGFSIRPQPSRGRGRR